MWELLPIESEGTGFFLLSGLEYVVGRKNCEILLPSDQSISRVHATLSVSEELVSLKESSKYGTFVNDEKLASDSTKTLRSGDRVTFGVFQSKYRLQKVSLVVCSSCVDAAGKDLLSKDLQSVGGQLSSSWTAKCTHLVMPTVRVTIKTICALLSCRPIVTPAFFTAFCRAVQQKLPLPEADSFRPPLDEPSLTNEAVDLSSRPERKRLFQGKLFLFLNSKQMKRLSQAVVCGGGLSRLLSEGSLPVSLLQSSSTCVIDVASGGSQPSGLSASREWVESVAQILHRQGLRFIAESEIGLAAIHVNNQTYCNPSSSLHSESRVTAKAAAAALSQDTAVDETALAPPSQNITAYVVNTELSQNTSRMTTSGISAVSETPEKTHTSQTTMNASRLSAGSKASSLCREPVISETQRSFESSGVMEPAQKMKICASSARGLATSKASPPKQSSLSNYFKPVCKKRVLEDPDSFPQSEAKLFRKHTQNKEDAAQTSATRKSHKSLQSNLETQSHSNAGQGLISDHKAAHHTFHASSESVKRKQPESADLEPSLEDLESIMSEEMEIDVSPQPAANKKQRLKSEATNTVNNPPLQKQQEKSTEFSKKNPPSSDDNLPGLIFDKTGPHRPPKSSLTSTQSFKGQNSFSRPKKLLELEKLKAEELSFAVTSRPHGISAPVSEQEMQSTTSVSATKENDALPRRLLQIQFQSLTVKSYTVNPKPLQYSDPNTKNVKRFRKKNVPGFNVLPTIIGGSDLVAHNRSKNSELEEWFRQAAEDEKKAEREESQGDDLFRYNPRRAKK